MELELLNSLLSHLVLKYLSRRIHWEAVNEVDIFWALVFSHALEAESLDLLFGSLLAVPENNTCKNERMFLFTFLCDRALCIKGKYCRSVYSVDDSVFVHISYMLSLRPDSTVFSR